MSDKQPETLGRLEMLYNDFENQPLAHSMSIKLEELERGCAVVSMAVQDAVLVTAGMVQGGITSVVADFAGVYAAMSMIPEGHTPLADYTAHLFAPFRKDECLWAAAAVKNESKRFILVEVQVFSSDVFQDENRRAYFTFNFAKPRNK